MTDTIASQNIELPSWSTLYKSKRITGRTITLTWRKCHDVTDQRG